MAFCSAFEYDIDALLKHLAQRGLSPVMPATDCVSAMVPGRNGQNYEVYYFQSGGLVAWGIGDAQDERQLVESVAPFQREAVQHIEDENMPFVDHQSIDRPNVSSDGVIYVAGPETPQEADAWQYRSRDRLTCSYALLKSVQLSVLERKVEELVQDTHAIPAQLAKYGSSPLSPKAINIRLGKALQIRSQLNQDWEIQASPDITWDTPVLETLFSRMSKQLDLQDRCYALNQRLDYAKETLDLVRQSAAEKRSHFMELTIIILISIEIFTAVVPVRELVYQTITPFLK